MKKRFLFFLGALGWAFLVQAQPQDPVATKYGNTITAEDLKEYLSILASDAMEGRETGTRGQKMAAAFISAHFEEIGLSGPVNGTYYQHFNLYRSVPGDTYLMAGKEKLANFDKVIYYGHAETDGEESLPLVYLGLGSEEDFNTIDVKDKAVLIRINDGRLYNLDEAKRARDHGAKLTLIWNTDSEDDFNELASQAKARAKGGRLSTQKEPRRTSMNASSGMFVVSPQAAATLLGEPVDKLMKLAEDGKPKSLKKIKETKVLFKVTTDVKTVETENVLGYLEGTDKKDELVVVTAHYDHIGKRSRGEGDLINNGADDDGSGSVSVMELAQAFAQAKAEGHGPRRSMLFMTVAGEEKGLLGSDFYTKNPVFPLENTVVDLNIDMVGRRDAEHKDSPPYVYVIGSDKLSTELHKISEQINNTYTKLVFDYTYNDEDHPTRLYYRSDHWNFAKNNIPIIFYFDGIHEDYHKPSDEVDKIEFDQLTKRAQCVFYTAWEIANRDARIVPDVKPKEEKQ